MMELWNDFEGKSVDGKFTLGRLIGPSGRSAFFETTDAAGAPAVIRLIESLNDEDEILGRWRIIEGLRQPNLVELRSFGKTVLDGTHLVYSVMEPTDAELKDVLRERPLTADETRQLATSILPGLQALHGAGLVHGHVDSEHVMAVGETVKLRSDSVRTAPEDFHEAEAARARDARDFATLLLQALTQRRDEGMGRLPTPFGEVVRNGMNGTWGLPQMRSSLGIMEVKPKAPVAAVAPLAVAVVPAGPAPGAAKPPTAVPSGVPAVPSGSAGSAANGGKFAAAAGAAAAERTAAAAPAIPPSTPAARVAAPVAASASRPAGDRPAGGVTRDADRIVIEPEDTSRKTPLIIGGVVAALVLAFAGWHFSHGSDGPKAAPDAAQTPAPIVDNAPPAGASAPEPTPAPAAPAKSTAMPASGAAAGTASGSSLGQWRVVAYTYNRQDQAQHKAAELAQKHPDMKPEAWSPTGKSPYLVTLGGPMGPRDAINLRMKALKSGFPRDVFARNYRGH